MLNKYLSRGDELVLIAKVERPVCDGEILLCDDGTYCEIRHPEGKYWCRIPGVAKLVLCVYGEDIPRSLAAVESVELLRDRYPIMFDRPVPP